MSSIFFLFLSVAFAQFSYEEALIQLEQSPQLVLARLHLETSQAQLGVASSLIQGELSGGYGYDWTSLNANGFIEPETTSEGDIRPLTLSTSFNVVPYGPRYDQTLRARWAVERAKRALRDEQARAVLNLTEQFGAALLAEKQFDLEKMRLELSTVSLKETETRLAVGAATATELAQAQLAVQESEATLEQAFRQLEQSLFALSLTLGQDVSAVSGGLPASERLAETLLMLEARTDVANARTAVLDAELSAASNLREVLPTATMTANYTVTPETGSLSLGAGYDLRSFQPSLNVSYDPDFETPNALAGQRSSRFSLGLSATVPLDIALGDALRANELALSESRLQANEIIKLALQDVDLKRLEVDNAEAQASLAVLRAQQAALMLETAKQRFEAGIISQLELKSAALEVLTAELALLQRQTALRTSHLNLAIAYGQNPLEVYK